MSEISHPHPSLRVRARSLRLVLALATVLALSVVVILVAVSSVGSDSRSSGAPSTRSGAVEPAHQGLLRHDGPNETARGNAAASSAGASQPSQAGGPNESARGNAAASAAR